MVYIIAGATGVVGSAISKELAKENEVHLIGRDEEKLSSLSKDCLLYTSDAADD